MNIYSFLHNTIYNLKNDTLPPRLEKASCCDVCTFRVRHSFRTHAEESSFKVTGDAKQPHGSHIARMKERLEKPNI